MILDKNMQKSFDTIVLGSGVAGVSTAIALARKKKKVLILDKKGIHGVASPASAGILDPVLGFDAKHPLLKFSLDAFKTYPAMAKKVVKESGVSFEYHRTGMMYLAFSRADCRKLNARFSWNKKLGLGVQKMSDKALRSASDTLGSRVHGGLYYPTIGRVHPPKLMVALSVYATKLGVQKKQVATYPILLSHDNKVEGVAADLKEYYAGSVVNATGSWSGCQRQTGLKLPVQPVRGQLMIVRGSFNLKKIVHGLDGTYIVPWAKKMFLVGSTVERVGYDADVSQKGIESILKRAQKMIPSLKENAINRKWAGLRPCSKDELPIIGEDNQIRGLFHASAYFRSGILIAMHAGELLAALMTTGQAPASLKSFSPARFG